MKSRTINNNSSTLITKTDVVILCGGRGKRLGFLTRTVPKPMIKFGKTPFLDILVSYLVSQGYRRIILVIGYKAHRIKSYFIERRRTGTQLIFSIERKPLGTGGGLKYAKRFINSNPFMVINGDTFSDVPGKQILRFHKNKKALVTMLVTKCPSGKDFGQIVLGKTGRILKFLEKNPRVKHCLINAGVYVFDRKIFSMMPRQKRFSLEKDFFPRLVQQPFFGYRHRGIFMDIGTPQRLKTAREIMACSPLISP